MNHRVLVTGATGHVGALLVPELLKRGWSVSVLTRRPEAIKEFAWGDRVEIAKGDASDAADVRRALAGVEVAYYLLHSMDGKGDFVERDREMANTFADAAKAEEVRRVVYLSGLHPEGELSPHLASRVEVGEILMASGVPTAVLQAGIVLGEGSASFEMLRHLSERLPAFVAPKWLRNQIQPISDADIVHYLAEAATLPDGINRTFDIGGPDVLTYADMMRGYAKLTGLGKRYIATVPVLTPKLASHWVGLVTPVSSGIARPLVGSLIHDAVCHEHDIEELVAPPPGGKDDFETSIARATANVDAKRWSRNLKTSAALVGTAAVAGSLLSDPESRWYRSLDKPSWQPPAAAFPIVWTALYADVIAAATATMSEAERDDASAFAKALALNMGLNAAWSGIFFRLHAPKAATLAAAALAVSGADLTRRAAPVGRGKAVALAAYAGWCGFATALSAAIARRNS